MNKLLEKVNGGWEKFKAQSKKIKIAIIAAILAIFIAIICTIVYSSSNKYQVLFSDLEASDAQVVVNALGDEKVDYKIEGSSILVPKESVDELRLKLAPNLTSGSKGYELMDNGSSFGMTDEEFQIKKLRMLQGELEKTIKSFPQVEEARVHITQATDTVFAKEKEPGKAAVYLKIKQGNKIDQEQVKSIVALVSGSTENTPKENIDVIDDNMNLLTKDINNEDDVQSASSETLSKQQDAEKSYEDKLQKAIVNLLEPVVGKDKVKATVNVNLDFDSKQKTQTVVDPNKVIISQETSKETNTTNGTDTNAQSPVDNNMTNTINNTTTNNANTSSKEDQKTNYDVGKSETKTISAPGEVKRLTASVVVDGNLDAATQTSLQDIVSNAIGLDATRGDQVSVLGMAFDQTSQDANQNAVDAFNAEIASKKTQRLMIFGGIGIAVLLGVITLLVIKMKNKKKKQVEEDNTQLLDALVDDSILPKEVESFEPINFDNNNEKSHLEKEIKNYATEKPEQVVEIIKSWLTENER